MKLIHYTDIAAFWQVAEPALLEREVEHNMMLAQCKTLVANQAAWKDAQVFSIMEGETWQASLVQKGASGFIASNSQSPDIMGLFASYYQENQLELGNIFGEKIYAEAFAQHYHQKEKERVEILVHRLEKLKPIPFPSGSFAPANADDADTVVAWVKAFEEDINDVIRRPIAQLKQETDNRIAQALVFKWVDEGEMRSMAVIMRRSPNVATIGLVYTPPAQRGKGYAAACTYQLSQYIFDKGYRYCALFTDKNNLISNHIYSKMGYECLGEFVNISFFCL